MHNWFRVGEDFNNVTLLAYETFKKAKTHMSTVDHAVVLCVIPFSLARDKFVTWFVWYNDEGMSCSWGHYFDNLGDAWTDYQKRCDEERTLRSDLDALYERGREDGSTAASWLVDGNTPDPVEALKKLVQGIDDGDPEIMDQLPQPRLGGEFAGDPTWEDVLKQELDEYDEDKVQSGYYDGLEDAYYTGFQHGVELQLRHKLKVYQTS